MQRKWLWLLAFLLIPLVVGACTSESREISDEPVEVPAADNEFRSDPPSRFASTGKPQLVEFFTYW